MKKNYYLFLVAVFCNVVMNAQVVYSDQFDGFNSALSNSGYSVTLENETMKAVGNGTAAAYQAFQYNIHDSGNLTSINMQARPQLYIKAKASIPGVLRVDVKDSEFKKSDDYGDQYDQERVDAFNLKLNA